MAGLAPWLALRVVHFTETTKPWGYRDGHPLAHLYFRYLRMTPFYDQVRRNRRLSFGTTHGGFVPHGAVFPTQIVTVVWLP